ncbi:MAG: hypothetical protein WBR56_16910 [Sedimenticolaceae bacterium]
MNDAGDQRVLCPHCGQPHDAAAKACPACGVACEPAAMLPGAASEWAHARDGLKTKWVVSVIAFWVSVVILGVVFFIEQRLNLTLASIALGMLVIGIWLKTRYQMRLRNDPSEH